jgi:hypothetical protein
MGQEASVRTAGRVTAVTEASAFRQFAERQPREQPRPEPTASRALTVTPSGSGSERPLSGRAFAPFLAHLAAVRQQAPQFRQRRRAEPAAAAACYAAGGRAAPARPRLNRSA